MEVQSAAVPCDAHMIPSEWKFRVIFVLVYSRRVSLRFLKKLGLFCISHAELSRKSVLDFWDPHRPNSARFPFEFFIFKILSVGGASFYAASGRSTSIYIFHRCGRTPNLIRDPTPFFERKETEVPHTLQPGLGSFSVGMFARTQNLDGEATENPSEATLCDLKVTSHYTNLLSTTQSYFSRHKVTFYCARFFSIEKSNFAP
jgi:hypothetical protein